MTVITQAQPAVKTRKRRERHARISRPVNGNYALELTVGKDTFRYWLEPIPADTGSGFRLIKWVVEEGEPDRYHVNVNGMLSSCECRGFLRHGMCADGKGCKHIAGLAALMEQGKLEPHKASKPAAAPATDFDDNF